MTTLLGVAQALLAVALFWLPGITLLVAAGFSGWLRISAVAPAATTAVFALGSMAAAKVGVRWNLPVAVVLTAVVAVTVWLLRRRFRPAQDAAGARPDHPPAALRAQWALASLIGASVLLQLAPVRRAILARTQIPNATDPLFHLTALQYVREFGVADPVTMGSLVDQAGGTAFYPAAWHAVAALVPVLLDATSVMAASSYVVVALAWTAGLAALTREVATPTVPHAPALAAVMATSGLAAPVAMALQPGILPNAVAIAIVPGVAAVTISALRGPAHGTRGRTWAVVALCSFGLAACHPNGLVGLALATLPWVWSAVRRWWSGASRRARNGALGSLAVIAVGAWIFVTRNGLVGAVRSLRSEDPHSVGDALVGLLVGRTAESFTYALVPMALAIGGAVWRVRRRGDVRPVVTWIALGGLYMLAATAVSWATPLTGLFYTEGRRVAPFVAIWTVVLAADALARVSTWLVSRVRVPARLGVRGAAALVSAVLLAISAYVPFLTLRSLESKVYTQLLFVPVQPGTLVPFFTPNELLLAARLGTDLPDDAVVFGSGHSGSSHLYGLVGVDVVPFYSSITQNLAYAADHIADLGSDPGVCEAFVGEGITHIYVDPYLMKGDFWPNRVVPFMDLPDEGLRLIDEGGAAKVYEVTGCGE